MLLPLLKNTVRRAGYFLSDPAAHTLNICSRAVPSIFYDRYSSRARRQGLGGVRFLLSFDCDISEDLSVVQKNHERLLQMGVRPMYVVPGELLEEGERVYRGFRESGSEFLNHGYFRHTGFDRAKNEYLNLFFYDQISPEKVVEDIRKGHECHLRLWGEAPRGFRVPHFGTFQKEEHLKLLYGTLRELGYLYSSSTSPVEAWKKGAIHQTEQGIWEFPLSGWYSRPFTVLDSWSFTYAPFRSVGPERFVSEARKLHAFFSQPGRAGLINIYADPYQVHDWDDFFEGIRLFQPWFRPSYESIIREVSP